MVLNCDPRIAATPAGVPGHHAAKSRLPIDAEVTALLGEWRDGNQAARDQLVPLLYGELRRIAARYLRQERAAHTLQPTALVHEAFLRLVQYQAPDWQNRAHFFGIAAHVMRQFLVERARRHKTQKRGGGVAKVPLEDAMGFSPESSTTIVNLDLALNALAEVDERKSKVIEMRFFGGLTVEETAETLGISVTTVRREQRLAEAWLHREMQSENG